jgi:hypothetical protein
LGAKGEIELPAALVAADFPFDIDAALPRVIGGHVTGIA